MVNAKDYLKVRMQRSLERNVPTLDELKSLLESVIDNGEDTFVDEGYIPLTCTLAEKIYNRYSAQNNDGMRSFDEEIQSWLIQHDWVISTQLSEASRLALFAIKD